MALQGTIETFALPDVLRLLASTKKTGRLTLEGSRGSGELFVADGQVVGGGVSASPHAGANDEVLFELLRFEAGDFVFEDDVTADSPGVPGEVEPLLDAAEQMLTEWKAIEEVVPSLDHHVGLVEELGAPEVTVSAASWKTLAQIGGGTSVGRLGDALALPELGVSKAVKELVELGLVEVGDPRDEGAAPAGGGASADLGSFGSFEESGSGFGSFEDAVSSEPEVESGGEESFESFDPSALVVEDVTSGAEEPGASDAAEIARQLANLSPKAAKAVAAAAKATTPEEREAALAEVDDQEDPINRDLLIKFLGSVNS